jgi:hypothetical protein
MRVMGMPKGRSGILRMVSVGMESAVADGWWPACGFSWESTGSTGRNAPNATASAVVLIVAMIEKVCIARCFAR